MKKIKAMNKSEYINHIVKITVDNQVLSSLVVELREENARLKALLESRRLANKVTLGSGITDAMIKGRVL